LTKICPPVTFYPKPPQNTYSPQSREGRKEVIFHLSRELPGTNEKLSAFKNNNVDARIVSLYAKVNAFLAKSL